MKTSALGIDIIKTYEGFSAIPYLCPAGKWTIGYGHCIKTGESFLAVTLEQAESLLLKDVVWAENAVNRLVKIPLKQGEFDALVSFIYNVGAQAFENAKLLMFLNQGDSEKAAAQFKRWIYANGQKQPGLIARRAAEMQLFCQNNG